jgi:hypothetical protein
MTDQLKGIWNEGVMATDISTERTKPHICSLPWTFGKIYKRNEIYHIIIPKIKI